MLGEPGSFSEALAGRLGDRGVGAHTAQPGSDAEAKQLLESRPWTAAAVMTRDDALALRLAPRAGIPVAIGSGEDRGTMHRLGIRRAAVVAAAMTVHDVSPDTPLVMRLGDGDVASETESLLHLGTICDVHHAVADAIVGEMLGGEGGPVAG